MNDQVRNDFLIYLLALVITSVSLATVVVRFFVICEQIELMSDVGKQTFAGPRPASLATLARNRCLC